MERSEQIENRQNEKPLDALAYATWMIALLATVGSLFFSEVMNLLPCALCWYQRIACQP